MLLYKTTAELGRELSKTDADLLRRNEAQAEEESAVYLSALDHDRAILCQVARDPEEAEAACRDYLQTAGLAAGLLVLEELSICEFAQAIQQGSEDDLCPSLKDVLSHHALSVFAVAPFHDSMSEVSFPDRLTREELLEKAAPLCSTSLTEEVERICSQTTERFLGHPVQYRLTCADYRQQEEMLDTLMNALHSTGRLMAGRACLLYTDRKPLPFRALQEIYEVQKQAAVIVYWHEADDSQSEKQQRLQDGYLTALAELAVEHHREVLTVFLTPDDDHPLLDSLLEGLTLVTLAQDHYDRPRALAQLEERMAQCQLGQGTLSPELLPQGQSAFTEQEIDQIFQSWYDRQLREQVYPQYAHLQPLTGAVEPAPALSGEEELAQLVGLRDAKRVIRQAVDYAVIRKLEADRGLPTQNLCMHMVFTGNPGTAKTTVARLVARIFRERGVLEKGELVEVGRSDLVDQYVGGTAKRVAQVFQRARGSVLFIDEAYALLDDRNGLHGDEAINTIVQQMENHRQDTVVIFGGYPAEMERFLERNPGLKSRVPYELHFPDYTEEELMDILALQLRQQGREVTEAAREQARTLIRAGQGTQDFGNGRYVRKLLEQAMLAQASRLVQKPLETIGNEELRLLLPEDFPAPVTAAQPARRIGFSL